MKHVLTFLFVLAFLLAAGLQAQTPSLRPLYVSAGGVILDDAGKPVLLRGLNRSGTGYGNANAIATDQEYAAQNQLLSMNLVRIFVNAAWWNDNVQVPIANLTYQNYIDLLIQRAKKYGNYVLILKAGQFPDPPCGTDGKNCPASNQGDLNCQANPAVCAAQDTTGNNTETAFTFWASFAEKYANDPAILYDTWEDMHGIDNNTWSDGQDGLIAAIRSYSPESLIFVEDTGTVFEAIASGLLSDLGWDNIVWNFHLYAGPNGTCSGPTSPRYANWPQNFSPLVSYAQQHGHAVAITEWGGCNDSEPYHTNITSYAKSHSVALAYFDSSNLFTQSGSTYQLTATGAKVAQAYSAIAASGPGPVATVSSATYTTALAPEVIAAAFGVNLANRTQVASSVPLPTNLDGTSILITDANGISRLAELFFVSSGQVNYEVPPGVAAGNASVAVSINGAPVAFGTVQITAVAPGLYSANANGQGVAAAVVLRVKGDGSQSFEAVSGFDQTQNKFVGLPIDLGPSTDQVFLILYGTGIRHRSSLASVSTTAGGAAAQVFYAGPQGGFVGLDQINVLLPRSLAGRGNVNIALVVDGQAANIVTVNIK